MHRAPGDLPVAALIVSGAVGLRAAGDTDAAFLAEVYASTRRDELAAVPFSDDELTAFLAQQFAAQTVSWRSRYPHAVTHVLQVDGDDAGRLVVDRSGEDILLVDVALLPWARGRGIGTRVVGDLLAEARRSGRRVVAHVAATNRARALYRRLGFREVASDAVYVLIEFTSEGRSVA